MKILQSSDEVNYHRYIEMQRIGAESDLAIKSHEASKLYHVCFGIYNNKVTRNPNLHPKLP